MGTIVARKRSETDGNSPHAAFAPSQLPLAFGLRDLLGEAYEQAVSEIEAIVATVGLKQAAFDLDEKASTIVNGIRERDGHRMALRWIFYFIAKAPNSKLADIVVGVGGLETKPRREITAEEELRRTREWLANNPALEKAWKDHVHGGRP